MPLPPLIDGTVPVTVTSVSVSPPRPPRTSCCRATAATELALSVPYWLLTRSLTLIFVPAAIWPLADRLDLLPEPEGGRPA